MKESFSNITQCAIEDRLMSLLSEYAQAEQEGKPHAELVAIYKQIKELKFQTTLSHPAFQPLRTSY